MREFYDFLGEAWPVIMILGVLIGILIGVAINGPDIKELGHAICEEEYDMDYDMYSEKVLKCKPKTLDYDGLQVMVRQVTDDR